MWSSDGLKACYVPAGFAYMFTQLFGSCFGSLLIVSAGFNVAHCWRKHLVQKLAHTVSLSPGNVCVKGPPEGAKKHWHMLCTLILQAVVCQRVHAESLVSLPYTIKHCTFCNAVIFCRLGWCLMHTLAWGTPVLAASNQLQASPMVNSTDTIACLTTLCVSHQCASDTIVRLTPACV